MGCQIWCSFRERNSFAVSPQGSEGSVQRVTVPESTSEEAVLSQCCYTSGSLGSLCQWQNFHLTQVGGIIYVISSADTT